MASVNQNVCVLPVTLYCSQTFPTETVRLGILVTMCYSAVCGKTGIFVSQPEPNVFEQFYTDFREKLNEITSCILNYQIHGGVFDTYRFTFSQID